MSCIQCGQLKCGCKDRAFTTTPTFACPPNNCPTPEPCSEIIDANCVAYTGYGIVELGINTGDRLNDVIQKLALSATNPSCINLLISGCKSPTNLNILSNTTNGVTSTVIVSWVLSTSTSTTDYQVEYIKKSEIPIPGVWTQLPTVGPTITQDTIGNLDPGIEYYIRVNAIDSVNICNCYSVTLIITT